MSRGRLSPIALTAMACLLLVFTHAACDGDASPPATSPSGPTGAAAPQPVTEVAPVRKASAPFLPAYNELGFKPNPLKADQYDDIRDANPENFAITQPPSGTVRAMVEWEPMHAIVMSYPAYMAGATNASETMAKVAMHSATVADVWFIVDGQAAINAITGTMQNVGMPQGDIDAKVHFFQKAAIDSIWFIDSGPLPIIDTATNTYAFADFRYYHQRPYDDSVPSVLGRNLVDFGLPSDTETYRMPVSTEGGTFQATTDGICFTGSRQLYNMSCGAGACDNSIETAPLSQLQDHTLTQELEQQWAQYLGCKDVIVTYSITDDGTGHIDMYLKVIDDDTVMIGEYVAPFANNAQQTNATRMDQNAAFIDAYVKPSGGAMNSVRLIMPGHKSDNSGSVPFTYVNSTFINGLNLWPATENDSWTDKRALAQSQWEAAMPAYTHQYIDAEELSFWSGAIHCVTRTIPAVAPAKWIGDGSCGGSECGAPTGGYDGLCSPGSDSPANVCWGPAWECYCNNCALCPDGPGTNNACNGITYEGCCTGDELSFCANGAITSYSCNGQGCGWVAQGNFYDCSGNGADPSGAYPLQCPGDCAPDCQGKACGDDGCGGSCGACPAGQTCDAGTCEAAPCVPQCAGAQCGPDGCGGDCGACPDGQTCESGACSGGSGDADAPDGGASDSGGTTPDAGPSPDAGTGPVDGGSPNADGGGGADAVVSGDSAANVDGAVLYLPPTGGDRSGCGAAGRADSPPPAPLLAVMAWFGLAWLSRRRA